MVIHATPSLEIVSQELQRRAVATLELQLLRTCAHQREVIRRPQQQLVGPRQRCDGGEEIGHAFRRRVEIGRARLLNHGRISRRGVHLDIGPVIGCGAPRPQGNLRWLFLVKAGEEIATEERDQLSRLVDLLLRQGDDEAVAQLGPRGGRFIPGSRLANLDGMSFGDSKIRREVRKA